MNVRRIVIIWTAALAVCGLTGMVPSAVQASSTLAATWTKQAPASHPSGRGFATMAYDAATGNAVLFGGTRASGGLPPFGDTWTWNGTIWTKQVPATSPPARYQAAMAYDAATGNVVLFGGLGRHGLLDDTWTWNGTTWTKQAPATSPPARDSAAMAYDAATGNAVLFGGLNSPHSLGDTWTWNGTTWTKQAPATRPPARAEAAMAYDAATGNVVLFGGDSFKVGSTCCLADTWTWDGTTWTKQAPAASPPGRTFAAMAYDAATGNAVLFGGTAVRFFRDTWTWDGSTWTEQAPTAHPSNREGAAMAYDAATGNAVLFGGLNSPHSLGDTWTWG